MAPMADPQGGLLGSEHIRMLKICLASLNGSQSVLADIVIHLYKGGDKRPDVFVTQRETKTKHNENKDPQKHSKKKNKKPNSAEASTEKPKEYFSSFNKAILKMYPKDESKPYNVKEGVKNYDTSLLFQVIRFTCGLQTDDELYEKCSQVKEIRNKIHDFHKTTYENEENMKKKMEEICKLYEETYKLLGSICHEDMSAYIKDINDYIKDLEVSPIPTEDWKVYQSFLDTKGKKELVDGKYSDMGLFQPTNDPDMCFPVKEVYTPQMLSVEDSDSDTPSHHYPADDLLKSSDLWGNSRILLVGKPGSGKTAFIQHIISLWCDQVNNLEGNPGDPMIVLDQIQLLFYIDLSLVNEGEELKDLISQSYMPNTCLHIPSEKIVQSLIGMGSKVLWLFDSFDEAVPRVRKTIINEVCRKFEHVIVTCRPDFTEAVQSITKKSKWKVLGLIEMNDKSIEKLSNKVFKILHTPPNIIKDFNRFIEARSKSFISLKSSPLHLTLLCWLWSKADHTKTDVKKIATTCSLYFNIMHVITQKLAEKLLCVTGYALHTVMNKFINPWMKALCTVAFYSFAHGTKKLNENGIQRLKEFCQDNVEVQELIFSTMLHSKRKENISFNGEDYVYFLCHSEMLEFLAAKHVHRNLQNDKTINDFIRGSNYEKAANVLTHLAGMVVEDPQKLNCDNIVESIINKLRTVWTKKKLESETYSRNFNPWFHFINETKSYPKAIECLTKDPDYFPVTDIDLQQFHDVLGYIVPNFSSESDVRVMVFGDICDCPAIEKILNLLKTKKVYISLDLYKSFHEDINTNATEPREVTEDDQVEILLKSRMCDFVRVTAHLSESVISDLSSAKLKILQLRITHVSQLVALKKAMNNLDLKVLTLSIAITKNSNELIPLVAEKKNSLTFNLVLNDVMGDDIVWCHLITSKLYNGQYFEIRINGQITPKTALTLYTYLKKMGIQFKAYKTPRTLQTDKHSIGGHYGRADYSVYVGRLDPKMEEDQLEQRIKLLGINPEKIIKLITPLDEYAAAFRVELKDKYECFAVKTGLVDEAYTAYWYSEENEYLSIEMAASTRGTHSGRKRTLLLEL